MYILTLQVILTSAEVSAEDPAEDLALRQGTAVGDQCNHGINLAQKQV